MIMEQLEELRAAFAQCRALALADLASGTIYRVSAREKQPQERFDAMCAAAAEVFCRPPGDALARASGHEEARALNEVMLFRGDDLCIFLRAPWDPGEAVLCLCEAALDVDAFLEAARERLAQIAAAA